MMKFAASVSLAALALAGCAATAAAAAAAGAEPAPTRRGTRRQPPFPLTVDGARAFVAAVEKDLFDFSVIGSRAAWVNATYINDDTDALAAYFGTIGTEKGVKYAIEAAQVCRRFRASISTPRASSTSCAARWSCRRRRRRAPPPSSTTSRPGCSRPTARAAPRITARRSPATMPKR